MNKHQDNPIQELKGDLVLPWSRPFLFRLRKLGPCGCGNRHVLQASLQACVRLDPAGKHWLRVCPTPALPTSVLTSGGSQRPPAPPQPLHLSPAFPSHAAPESGLHVQSLLHPHLLFLSWRFVGSHPSGISVTVK